MKVDYQAAIMVGLHRMDFKNVDVDELVEDEELQMCAPYHEGRNDPLAVIGFFYATSGTDKPNPFQWNQGEIDRLKETFKEITGQDAKIWISTLTW